MDKLVENSTIHGVTHAHSTKNKIAKIFWISLIILGFGGIATNIAYVIDKYLKYPVEVSLTLEKTFEWPELTICNRFAPFAFKENSSKHIYWKSVVARLDQIVNQTGYHYKDWETAMKFVMDSVDVQRLGPSPHNNLISFMPYSYDGRALVKPSYSGFRKMFRIRNKMFSFNYNVPCYSLKLLKNSLDEYRDITSFVLSVKLDPDSNRIFNKGYRPRSLYLFLDNEDEISDSDLYPLTPGYRYIFDISQSRYIHKQSGKSCRTERFTTDIYDLSMTKSTTYEGDYRDCLKYLNQKQVLKDCKCYMPGMPIHKSGSEFPRLCYNVSLFTVEQLLENIKCEENFKRRFYEECEKYKLRKCDSKSYKISLFKEQLYENSRFMSDNGRDILSKSYGRLFPKYVNRTDFADVVKDSLFQMVFQRQSEFVEVRKEEYSYILSQLLSDIGGLMGLFLGISVFVVFEIVHWLCYFFKSVGKGKQRVPKDVQMENVLK